MKKCLKESSAKRVIDAINASVDHISSRIVLYAGYFFLNQKGGVKF